MNPFNFNLLLKMLVEYCLPEKAAQEKAAQAEKAAQEKAAQEKAAQEKAAQAERAKQTTAVLEMIASDSFTFSPENIVDLYNQFRQFAQKETQNEILTKLNSAFEILDECKGKSETLTTEHIQKMEPTMLEKVQYNLKIAVNKLLDLVKQEDKKYDLKSEKVTQHENFKGLIQESREAAKLSLSKV